MRTVVTLEEWPPMRLRYGLEISDEAADGGASTRSLAPSGGTGRTFGVGAAGDVGLRNLFGRGWTIGAAGRWQRSFQAGRLFATMPTLFGLPVVSNAYVTRSHETVGQTSEAGTSKFATDDTSATFEQKVRAPAGGHLSWRYAFEHIHAFEVNPDPTNTFPLDVTANVGRLASTLVFDTRDDVSDATRGMFHSSDVEYAGAALGSDLRFLKYLLQQRYYRRAGPLVLAGAAQVGLADSFGQSLLPSERYFAGGGNTVRGYAQDSLGPRDILGDPAGGNALVVINGEARFPIARWVGGVGFLDAGQVYDAVRDIRFGELAVGAGAGVRVHTPFALIRVDFGVPLSTKYGPRTGRWFFSIGQAF
jgi:outer membrane protein assembly factor BamA